METDPTPIDHYRKKLDEVARRLDAAYGPRPWRRHNPPLDELVVTVLSQHTSDVNTERAYASLRARFPTWDAVQSAATDELVEAIRRGGLARIKAPRIQRILAAIGETRDSLTLDDLAELPLESARAALLALDGVGPKTAACVLLFSLGMPAMPVDTHVHRVALRTGLIPGGTSAKVAHTALEALIGDDRDRVYALHMEMISHGRHVCHARRPRCEWCVLTDCCDYFAAQRDAEVRP